MTAMASIVDMSSRTASATGRDARLGIEIVEVRDGAGGGSTMKRRRGRRLHIYSGAG